MWIRNATRASPLSWQQQWKVSLSSLLTVHLHWEVAGYRFCVAALLSSKFLDLATTWQGMSPLTIAQQNGHRKIKEIILVGEERSELTDCHWYCRRRLTTDWTTLNSSQSGQHNLHLRLRLRLSSNINRERNHHQHLRHLHHHHEQCLHLGRLEVSEEETGGLSWSVRCVWRRWWEWGSTSVCPATWCVTTAGRAYRPVLCAGTTS